MAARLLAQVCGEDDAKWCEAGQAAGDALRARIAPWDGVLAALPGRAAVGDSGSRCVRREI
jgi:hypothetical protein